LHAGAILVVETRNVRAVDIPHAEQAFPFEQRHDDFRARRDIAGDVAGKRVHVPDHLRLARRRRRAADALADRDAHAGGLALERTDHELGAVEQIEAAPVDRRYRVPDERREIRGVGDQIALARQKALRLLGELGVLVGLAGGTQCGGGEHPCPDPDAKAYCTPSPPAGRRWHTAPAPGAA
jgi:hypothetical protein